MVVYPTVQHVRTIINIQAYLYVSIYIGENM